MTDYTNARAVYFPDDDNGNPDSWQVQAGEYADEPDLVIVVDDSEAVFDTAEVAKISDRAQAIAPAGVRVECVPLSQLQEWTPSLPWA